MLRLAIKDIRHDSGIITWRANGCTIAKIGIERHSGGLTLSNGQTVRITRTACRYGGFRQWFACPRCRRRCSVLYGSPFYCRQCHRLNYTSTSAGEADLLFERMDKIRRRLKLDCVADISPYCRPKGMHRKTFERLYRRFEELKKQEFRIFGHFI